MKRRITGLFMMVVMLVNLFAFTAEAKGSTTIQRYNAGGKTLEDVWGCSRENVLDVLAAHVNDTYYLGTPYGFGDYRNPNGDKYHKYGVKDTYGVAAMNCTGFVWHVLTSAGGSNVRAMGGWASFMEQNGIEYCTYINDTSVDDLIDTMIEDGYVSPGDIIWAWDANTPVTSSGLPNQTSLSHHVGIYIGDYFDGLHTANVNWLSVDDSKDRWWHSTDYQAQEKGCSGNQTSNIHPITSCNAITVVKLSHEDADGCVYRDVKSDAWYYNSVVKVTDAGLMNGYPNGNFGPNDSLTRGQFATILHRIAGQPAVGDANVFSDVAKDAYYRKAISWGYQNAVIEGLGNGKFGPDNPITREQIVTLMYRYAKIQGLDTTVTGDHNAFSDGTQVSDYAKDAMDWAIGKGIIQGDGKGLKPLNNVTRAECAAIISRYLGL